MDYLGFKRDQDELISKILINLSLILSLVFGIYSVTDAKKKILLLTASKIFFIIIVLGELTYYLKYFIYRKQKEISLSDSDFQKKEFWSQLLLLIYLTILWLCFKYLFFATKILVIISIISLFIYSIYIWSKMYK